MDLSKIKQVYQQRGNQRYVFDDKGKYLLGKNIQLLIMEGQQLLFSGVVFVILVIFSICRLIFSIFEVLQTILAYLMPLFELVLFVVSFLAFLVMLTIKSSKFELLKRSLLRPYGLIQIQYQIDDQFLIIQCCVIMVISIYVLILQIKKTIQYLFRSQTRKDFINSKIILSLALILSLIIPFKYSGVLFLICNQFNIMKNIITRYENSEQ